MCKKEKVIRTKVTEMLGIEYPIIQGCMQWIPRGALDERAGAALAAAEI